MIHAVPTARDEAWRYSDHKALARLWPLPAHEAITVPAGGTFSRVVLLDGGGIRQLDLTLGAGASAVLHAIHLGEGYGRIEIAATLSHGARLELNGAQIADGDAVKEIVALIHHAEPGATSRQSVRTVASGKATGSYLGKILVAKDAQQTDAEQSSKALLLARTATVNTKPELEIYADDVKCTHGATVGELDKNALFYLETRGLAPAQARALLIEAFMADLIATIGDDKQRAHISAAITARLHAMVSA